MDNLPINVVDIAVIAVLLISAVLAYARGFVGEVLNIGAWIGAVFAVIYGAHRVKPYMAEYLPGDMVAYIASGVVVFILSLAILSMLTRKISTDVKGSALGPLDRALGFLFGLIRGALVLAGLFIAADWAVPRHTVEPNTGLVLPGSNWPVWVEEARAMPMIEMAADLTIAFIPQAASEAMGKTTDSARAAQDRAKKLLDAQQMLEDAITPTPEAQTTSPDGAYGNRARSDMDRLFETSQ